MQSKNQNHGPQLSSNGYSLNSEYLRHNGKIAEVDREIDITGVDTVEKLDIDK
jgi:hypothetical protein